MKKAASLIMSIAFVAIFSAFTGLPTMKAPTSLTLNTEKSRIDWVAAKKSDFHTGTFGLKSGSVQVEDGKLMGGSFVIDMANLKVTDASAERLGGHLKSADFFDVAKFAEATFTINTVNYVTANTVTIAGTLNLKGVNVPVSMQAQVRNLNERGFFAQAFLSIDRTLMGINWGPGNVANDIQLAIHIFAK